MEEKIDYIIKKLNLDRRKTVTYNNNTTSTNNYVQIYKNDFELIFDSLVIILHDYQIIIEFNNKELIEKEPSRSVMTSFFTAKRIFGSPQPNDDICELKWFTIADLKDYDIVFGHKDLLTDLKNL